MPSAGKLVHEWMLAQRLGQGPSGLRDVVLLHIGFVKFAEQKIRSVVKRSTVFFPEKFN